MNQISNIADKKLNKLSRDIGKAEAKIAEGTQEKDTAWDTVFEFMAEFDQPYFLASDGFTLTRQKRQAAPKLDEEELYRLLMARFTKPQVKKIWDAITDRKVNSLKLEIAVQNGVVPPDIIDRSITEPEPTYARVRRVWSKQDEERARVFGVEKENN